MRFPLQQPLRLVVGLALALSVACASHPAPPAPQTEPLEELALGGPVERELAPGATHTFQISIAAGEYVRILARPQAVDIALRLTTSLDEPVAEADGPGGSREREMLSLVTTAGGPFRLLVTRRDDGVARRYRLELQERRVARAGDNVRVEAEHLFFDGIHRRALGEEEAVQLASERFERSLQLWRSIDDRPGEIDCLNQLGGIALQREDTTSAIARFKAALELAESSAYRQGLGESLNNLGLAYSRARENTALAPHYFRRAREVWREAGDIAEAARTLHNLGLHHVGRNEMQQALEALEEALPLRLAAGDLGGEAWTRQLLGLLSLVHLGDTKAALAHLVPALQLSKAAGNLKAEATVLSTLATVHRQRGELQDALRLGAEAAERLESISHFITLANVLEELGGLYLELGDDARAAEQYERVLAIYRDQGRRDFESRVLSSIGLTYFRRGRLDEALAAYDQALAASRDTGNRAAEITALHRRGVALHARGELQQARADLEASLAMQETGSKWERASTLLDIGSLLVDLDDPLGAEARFGQALELARRTENLAVQSIALLRWAELARNRGDLETARGKLEEALTLVESARRGVLRQDLQGSYLATRRSYYDALIDVLMRMEEAHPGNGFSREAFAVSERARARGLSELLAEGRIDVRRGIAEEFREREIGVGVRISRLQSSLIEERLRQPNDEDKLEALEVQLERALEERRNLEAEIRSRHPRYAEVRYPDPPSVAELQRTLDPDTAFLEYAIGREASFLFVVTDRDFRAFRLPAAVEIESAVERFCRTLAIQQRRLLGQLQQTGHALYLSLVGPAAELLRSKPKWIVSPDGAVHLLPFEALPVTAPTGGLAAGYPSYLIERHAILYAPSAEVLRGLRAAGAGVPDAAADYPSFVAFADPLEATAVEGDAARERVTHPDLPRLRATRHEVEAVADLYRPGKAVLYLGPEATEENVKSGALAAARRVQFAVHGHLDEVRPELSGLHLARGGTTTEDGILQAYEIFNLDLSADLVVLSACETGLGRRLAGEGLVGLSRAFFYAGAQSLVVSLWKVADSSTADIMIEFHRRLIQGEDKASALRGAKLEAIRSSARSHPFHWAPFILTGDG